jgi:hypothetical protein
MESRKMDYKNAYCDAPDFKKIIKIQQFSVLKENDLRFELI